MDKYIVVAPGSAVPGPGGEEGARMMARHVAAALELGCAGLVVNLLDPDGRGPREEQPTPDEEARALGATELWAPAGTVLDRARFGDDWVYRVDGHRPKARPREWDLGAPSPEVKTIFGVTRQAAGRDEFRKASLEGHV